MARRSLSRRYRRSHQTATGEPAEWLPPDPGCVATMALVDHMPKAWRRVVKAIGIRKVLHSMDDGESPEEALETWGDCII